MGLTEDYMRELTESQPAMLAAMERMIPRIPLDAARWEGEMHEIAATFAAAGVTPKFHQGAGDMMALADRTPISAETRNRGYGPDLTTGTRYVCCGAVVVERRCRIRL